MPPELDLGLVDTLLDGDPTPERADILFDMFKALGDDLDTVGVASIV